MANTNFKQRNRLDTPSTKSERWLRPTNLRDDDLGGRLSEAIARFLGTPAFILWLTLFCAIWLFWNTTMPPEWRFDSAENGFTALTLVLSLQASYAAPLILLSQNRQDDRDRVNFEHDRARAERNLADTEYLARELASLRVALSETATRDFVRSELKDLLKDLREPVVADAETVES